MCACVCAFHRWQREGRGELEGVMERAVCGSSSSRFSQGRAICLRASALAAPTHPPPSPHPPSPQPPQHPAQSGGALERLFLLTSDLLHVPVEDHFYKSQGWITLSGYTERVCVWLDVCHIDVCVCRYAAFCLPGCWRELLFEWEMVSGFILGRETLKMIRWVVFVVQLHPAWFRPAFCFCLTDHSAASRGSIFYWHGFSL